MVQDKCAKFFKIPIKLPSGFTVYKIYKMESTSGVKSGKLLSTKFYHLINSDSNI